MFVEGRVLDTKGNPIAGAIIDTWETDGHGLYDTQVSFSTIITSVILFIVQRNAVFRSGWTRLSREVGIRKRWVLFFPRSCVRIPPVFMWRA